MSENKRDFTQEQQEVYNAIDLDNMGLIDDNGHLIVFPSKEEAMIYASFLCDKHPDKFKFFKLTEMWNGRHSARRQNGDDVIVEPVWIIEPAVVTPENEETSFVYLDDITLVKVLDYLEEVNVNND